MADNKDINDQNHFVEWFRSVAPYVHNHRGRTIVIQISGELLESEHFESTIHDIALLNSLGVRLVLVFGARPVIERKLSESGIASNYVNGLRVTGNDSLSCIKEAVGAARLKIEAAFSMGLPNSPMAGARIQVTSGNFVTAKPCGVIDGQDMEYTGSVRRIDADSIKRHISHGDIVIVPPLGYSTTGELFNLSSLAVATHTAVSLNADKLIFIFPFSGIKNEQGHAIHQMTQTEANELIGDEEKTVSPYTQLSYAIGAVEHGVGRVHLVDQNKDGALLQELFSRDGVGTLISSLPFDDVRKANTEDITGILELIQPMELEGSIISRSLERLELEIDNFTVIVRDGTVIACAALHTFAQEMMAEVACLVVHEDYRHQDKGRLLLQILEKEAEKQGMKSLFIMTTRAQHWFIDHGFEESQVSDLPEKKQSEYNPSRNSKVMVKKLTTN